MENYRLFIIVNPGLEDLALKELIEKCPVGDAEVLKGGIELTANLEWIERAHQLLKIPTRILLRVTNFKVRDFPKLYQKFAKFNWNQFLSHPNPSFEISCTKSRLNHTGRLDETIRKALDEAMIKQPLNKDWEKKNYPPQTFYVRLFDDELTLSLDLTGEPLYKRGLMKIKGEAPIRESFAAAMVYEIFAGISEKHDLVDPMCGSGTLLIEAQTFNEPLHLRPFAFETAPFYKGKLLRMTSATMALPVKETFGFDLNQELLFKVKAELGDEFPLKLESLDSVETKLNLPKDSIMICNPPYGERIKIKGQRGSFLREAWHKFLSEDKPLRFGWVLPSDMDDLFSKHDGYKTLQKRHFRNGGMAVTFWIWERI
jgi:putative N6-adenine-specific DNA methylase